MSTDTPEFTGTTEARVGKLKEVCPQCGVSVIGLVYEGSGTPYTSLMDPVGNERSHERIPHSCRPTDITAFEQRLDQLEQTLLDYPRRVNLIQPATGPSTISERENLALLAAKHAVDRPCPKCNASIGQICRNLLQSKYRHRKSAAKVKPHDERLPARNVA